MPDLLIGFGEMSLYKLLVLPRKLEGGLYPELPEEGGCVRPDPPDLFDRKFFEKDVDIPSGDHCKSMRLIVLGAYLCQDLREADTDRDRDPQLRLDRLLHLLCDQAVRAVKASPADR